jgi:hypothetical protein
MKRLEGIPPSAWCPGCANSAACPLPFAGRWWGASGRDCGPSSRACRLGIAGRWGCRGDADLLAAGAKPLRWPEPPPAPLRQSHGQISWAELFGYCEPMLLRDSDVFSMASSLELRVPFLDHRLVELALRMPQAFHGPAKGLLREACQDLFPAEYLNRPKQGFTLPMRPWMLGPLRGLCLDRLDSLRSSGWLDPLWIDAQWRAFEAEGLRWTRAWNLVVLGEFAARSGRPSAD